jgi:hypothetical protein
MEWAANTLYATSEHGVSSITTAEAHTSAASSRLNWRPRRFKWTRPLRRKTKSGFCACAITFQTQSTKKTWLTNFHKGLGDLWSNGLNRSNTITFDSVWSGSLCEIWRGTWIKVRLFIDFQILHHGLVYKSRNSKLVQSLDFEVKLLGSILGWVRNYLRQCIQTGSKANLVSYPAGTGVSPSGDLAVEEWSWSFTTISCRS